MTVLEPEEYVDNYKSGFQALFALMKPVVEGLHAAAVLNVQATRAAWAECACALQAALDNYAQADLGKWQLGAAQQTAQMAASYSRQLFEIATTTQAEWTKVAQVQYERINMRVQELSAGVFSRAPAGLGAPVDLVKATASTVHAVNKTPRTRRTRPPVAAQDNIDAASVAIAPTATQEAITQQR